MKRTPLIPLALLAVLSACRQEPKVNTVQDFYQQVVTDLQGVEDVQFDRNLCADSYEADGGCFVSKVNAADLAVRLAQRLQERGYDTRVRLQQNHLIWSTTVVRDGYGVVVHVDPLDRPNDDPRRVQDVKDGFRSHVALAAAPDDQAP